MSEKTQNNGTVFVQCPKCYAVNRIDLKVTSETVKHGTVLNKSDAQVTNTRGVPGEVKNDNSGKVGKKEEKRRGVRVMSETQYAAEKAAKEKPVKEVKE